MSLQIITGKIAEAKNATFGSNAHFKALKDALSLVPHLSEANDRAHCARHVAIESAPSSLSAPFPTQNDYASLQINAVSEWQQALYGFSSDKFGRAHIAYHIAIAVRDSRQNSLLEMTALKITPSQIMHSAPLRPVQSGTAPSVGAPRSP